MPACEIRYSCGKNPILILGWREGGLDNQEKTQKQTMNVELKDCALRPMAKRVRNHNKRNLRDKKVKSKTDTSVLIAEETSSKAKTGKICNLGVSLLSGRDVKAFAKATGTTDVVRQTLQKKEEILSEVQEWIARQQESDQKNPWLKKLNSADLYWLMTSSDPTVERQSSLSTTFPVQDL